MSDKPRFIRRNGKIIPIGGKRKKKDGNVDKRHVSNKMLAQEAKKLKPNKETVKGFGIAGASLGALSGLMSGKSIPSTLLRATSLGLVGSALGSIRITNKQDIANKLYKKKKKKK